MLEQQDLPDDLQTCQRMLLELSAAHERLQQVYDELLDTCTSMQESQQKLEQEKDELEADNQGTDEPLVRAAQRTSPSFLPINSPWILATGMSSKSCPT